ASPGKARFQALRLPRCASPSKCNRRNAPSQGINDSRRTQSKPAGVIQGMTRGLKTIFSAWAYSPGIGGGSVSGIGSSDGGCCVGSGAVGNGGGADGDSGLNTAGGGGGVNAGAVNVPLHNGQRMSCPAY